MERYIGCKLIKSVPMSRLEYNEYRGWKLPSDEDANDQGYLVEYLDGGKANHPDHEGYISWSPKDVFDNAYRLTSGMSFGLAIEAMKKGKKVAREGWNGKGQYVFKVNARNLQNSIKYGYGEHEGEPTVVSALAIKTTANQIQIGWLASQTDMLADDWGIV